MQDNGIVKIPSGHSVEGTLEKLQKALEAKAVTVFARIDHSGEAAKAGLHMPPTQVLIFGNPKGGTPLMLAAPSVAIDLPLKVLVAEDTQGKVWISYNSADYLQQRHKLPEALLVNLAFMEALVASAAS